ncbi:MAG: flagellar hook associated protein [Bdellovibrionales bacterium CG10_big_fil_rev_8_21_14_0_10_45_34]|nr:MAG: flagellar hook associated protein [Bdellovibrionales bacterium CG10_big_fil_rev_8_21_14_0_10_45_34]
MAISFGGINTGLPPNLVDQLVEAERIPIKNIETKKAKASEKLGLVNQLDEKLRAINENMSSLADSGGFRDMLLKSGDPTIVDGSVDPEKADTGRWNLEIVKLAEKAGAMSNLLPDTNSTELGVGYLRFETEDGDKEVFINGENNTLENVAKAINRAPINMRATIVQEKGGDEKGYRLLITHKEIGEEHPIDFPTVYMLDGDQDFFFDIKREASNGKIKLDGFEMEIQDNVIRDLIPGVTLDIKKQAPGEVITLGITEDFEVIAGKVKAFVDTMNEVLSFIQSQSKIDGNTDTSRTLGGDNLLRTVENRLRSLIQNPVVGIQGNYKRLSEVGVEFNRNGTLSYNDEKFQSALQSNPYDVHALFVGDGLSVGIIPTTKRTVGTLIDSSFGVIPNRKRGLQTNIDQMDRRIEGMERRVSQREQTLKRQFANLESTMSRLKQQGALVQAKMGGAGGGIGGLNFGGSSGGDSGS